ncbi:glycoside hydrolase family 78 protein [Actinoallomurus purpureus]|uniref:family 78 glycoside hydrolase catalytic domain n=1 Tax=Actinoallomurus purpureus TaxID=478114 RepID=UPI002092DD5B|nr:family 78 glycoside hydrolase catalytic domain [Actinoallomurus purpureus]MCO6009829.1 glycoside hydrolase family 78 protein [Actinoallomurus purpureus]
MRLIPAFRRRPLPISVLTVTGTLLATTTTGVVPASAAQASSPVRVTATTTERETNPIGIDAAKPRLGWRLDSTARGQFQQAYEVTVGSTPRAAGLWDSGRVVSPQSLDVPYGGSALAPGRRYYWRVRVWDGQGRATAWSKVSSFETGLAAGDWKASWVGSPATTPSLSGAHWIWYPEGDPTSTEPVSTRYFRRTVDLGGGAITRALFTLTADDGFTLYVNGQRIASSPEVTDSWKQGQLADVTAALHSGANTIAIKAVNTTQSPAGIVGRLHVERSGADPLDVITDGSFKAAQTAPDGWEKPGFDDASWPAAKDAAAYGSGPWGTQVGLPSPPVPYLRHEFTVTKRIAAARLYVTALGLYEARINGRRVGKDYFAPGWTDYRKRVQYQTYDVTSLLHRGGNAIGALLNDGWYAGQIPFAGSHVYGDQPWLLAQLRVDYSDGTSQTVGTDDSWKTAASPILASGIYAGETYDARGEQTGWDRAGFDDRTWSPVKVGTGLKPNLVAQSGPPVRVDSVLHPVKMTEPKPGVYLFDLGQNMVGWNRLKVSGPAGTTVTIRNGEVLNPDGTLYTTNMRGAPDTDHYTLGGGGTETHESRFTYRGYRYVELTGYPGTPDKSAVAGVVAHAGAPASGELTTSDPLVNQIQHNIVWSQKGNFFSVPTDCPQRDERLGWTGDIAAFAPTSTFNMDADTFLAKFTTDLTDAQRPDGSFTDVAPDVASLGSGTAAWGDAGVIVPFTLWQRYGDLQPARNAYPAMKSWIAYLQSHSTGLIRPNQGYGDWLNVDDGTPLDLIGTAYFAHSTDMVAQMADALGDHDQAASYRTLAGRIRDAFEQRFVKADGTVGTGSQTAYVLALAFKLLPDDQVKPAADKLVAGVEAHDGHLTTGFVGTAELLPTLTATGHTDVAYRILGQKTFPSWGYEIDRGATTIWERWDGIKPDGTFNDPGMNSFNHYGLGAVGDWLYQTVGGIAPAAPGYQRTVIRPRPGGPLTSASARYRSGYGDIVTRWKQAGGRFTLDVTVPVNTTAEVWVPAKDPSRVAQDGAKLVRAQDGYAVFNVGSGRWHFGTRA